MRERRRGGESFAATQIQQSVVEIGRFNPCKKDTVGYNNIEINTIILQNKKRKRKYNVILQ